MNNILSHLLRGGIAVTFIGAGLCICIDAGILKAAQKEWFLQGLLGLILFNTGISYMAYTAITKVKNDLKKIK